jgi:GreA/GreB family transcription elongation factor
MPTLNDTNNETEPLELRVALGTHVEIELLAKSGASEHLAFDLVTEREADFERGFLGINTPLAQALLDQAAGSTVPYRRGDIVQVSVLSVSASRNLPSADAAEKRQTVLRQAADQAELTNAVSFALTFDSKWGDYDPEGITANWEKQGGDNPSAQASDEKK